MLPDDDTQDMEALHNLVFLDALTTHYQEAAITQGDLRRIEALLASVIAKLEAMAELIKAEIGAGQP